MGFFKTLITGYKILWNDINTKYTDLIPRCFTGCGTGLMMIGSAVAAKTSMKEDVQQLIAEANAAVDESRAIREGEKKPERARRIFKAKAVKGLKVAKAYRRAIICEVAGATGVGIGYGMAEKGKHRALKAVGAVGAAFAAYRANVREDLGDEADVRYLTGRNAVKRTDKIDKKTGEVTEELEYIQDEDGVTIKKDPNAFTLLFSEETCPSVWNANYDLRMANLNWIEEMLTRKLQASDTDTTVGHISLNDMRREFGGLEPSSMDVDIGGIFGLTIDPDKPKMQQRVDLGYRNDQDFMEGRKDWCYITFPCDKESIVGRIKKKNAFKKVEK